jgi:hypothetical protein
MDIEANRPTGATRAALFDQEGAIKNLTPKVARNPLKSLDSDERIQGNPSFSNPSI